MCLSSSFFKFTLSCTLLLSGLSISYANGKPKANKTKPAATQGEQTKQLIPAAVRGSEAPEQIPDSAAYDLLLRSLKRENTANEVDQRRVQIQSRKTGIKESHVGKLLGLAESYGNRIAALDRRAANIKDRALPNPSMQDIEQLAKLQQEKEALVAEYANSMATTLDSDDAAKLRQYVGTEVKRNVVAVQLPQRTDHSEHKKIGRNVPKRENSLLSKAAFGFLPGNKAFTVPTSAQYGMGGYAYIYTEDWLDEPSLTVYGRGTVTQSYNSYGHTFLHTAKIRSSGWAISASNTLGYYNSPMSVTAGLPISSLIVNGELLDGEFILDFETTEKCPASYGALFVLPTLTVQRKVAVVDLVSLTTDQATLASGPDTLKLTANIKLSGVGIGTIPVNVIPYAQYTANATDIWAPSIRSLSFTGTGTKTAEFTYDIQLGSGQATPFTIDLKVSISADVGIVVLPHNDKKVTVTVTQ